MTCTFQSNGAASRRRERPDVPSRLGKLDSSLTEIGVATVSPVSESVA
jgi:hypothetical protein